MPESPNKLLNNEHRNYVFATFTGHSYDTTLDIYFAEARFYDADNRIWLAADPVKDGGNWYQYCNSNPTTYWDPTGLWGTVTGTKQAKMSGSEHSDILGNIDWNRGGIGALKGASAAMVLAIGITAVVATGGAAVTFGVADVLEALQDLGYGVAGSSKASFNPLRNTMFTGNEDLYYLVKTMATYGAVSGLYVYQSYDMGSQLGVTGGASFKPDELVVRDSKFLNADGDVDWETWPPNNGRVPDIEIEGQTLDGGILIDRYENLYGKYTSPVGVPYEQRSLPYFENPDAYHKYEVLKSINDVTISQISEAFEQPGGGVQYELPSSVNQLIKDGFLKEIK